MLMPNFTYKAGNIYTFPSIATASTAATIVFDRPVKAFRILANLSLADSAGNSIGDSDAVHSVPCLYGYPKRLYVKTDAESTNETPIIEVLEYGDHVNEHYYDNVSPIIFAIRAKAGTATMLGKKVNLLQSDVSFNNIEGTATGSLKYVTGYTGYSGDEDKQEGNYLAWAVDTTETGVTFKAWVSGGADNYDEEHAVTLDSDKDAVSRLIKTGQHLFVKATKDGRATVVREYDLSDLTLEEEA